MSEGWVVSTISSAFPAQAFPSANTVIIITDAYQSQPRLSTERGG